jgi:hypothetical protein
MGIGTFITAVVLGQVTSWPSALILVFGSVVVGVILYAVLALVRAPFIVIAQHHRQLSDVNQRLIEVEARSLDAPLLSLPSSETPTQAIPAQMSAASIEFVNFMVVDRWFATSGEFPITEEEPDDERDAETLKLQLMLARFYYKPERDVPPRIYIKAHLAIADSQGAPLQPRYDAVWDEDSGSEYKEFETADTHALVIGLLPKKAEQGLCIYQYGFKSGRFSPTLKTLPGQEFVLHLDLIGKINNITVLRAPMRFLLSLEPSELTFLG